MPNFVKRALSNWKTPDEAMIIAAATGAVMIVAAYATRNPIATTSASTGAYVLFRALQDSVHHAYEASRTN